MKRLSLWVLSVSLTVIYASTVVLAYMKWPAFVEGLAIAAGLLVIAAPVGAGVYLWRLTRPRKPYKITGDYRLVVRPPRREIMRGRDDGMGDYPYRRW